MGPNAMTGVLVRKEKVGTDTERHREKAMRRQRSR